MCVEDWLDLVKRRLSRVADLPLEVTDMLLYWAKASFCTLPQRMTTCQCRWPRRRSKICWPWATVLSVPCWCLVASEGTLQWPLYIPINVPITYSPMRYLSTSEVLCHVVLPGFLSQVSGCRAHAHLGLIFGTNVQLSQRARDDVLQQDADYFRFVGRCCASCCFSLVQQKDTVRLAAM